MVIAGPAVAADATTTSGSAAGDCATDSFSVSAGGGGRSSPIICGTNTGQHGEYLKVSQIQNEFMRSSFLQKYQPKILRISALEVYYFKVNTKRESIFFLQENRLSFVLTLKQ